MNSKFPISLLGCLMFFGVLWWLDFPKPFIDDLSYIGAGLNLAKGGDLSNFLLSRDFTEHFFYVYPPIHSYVLAGWLKIFGISAASLTGFQGVMYLLCTGAVIFILRKHQAPAWLEWITPLAIVNAFLLNGLRPEPCAAAMILVGFAMIECGLRNKLLVFLAFLLMSLGGGSAPRMTLYAMALMLFSLWRLCGAEAKNNRERGVTLGMAVGAGLLAGVIFLAMIGFRLKRFLAAFGENAQRIHNNTLAGFIMVHFSFQGLVILVLFSVIGFFVLRQPKDELMRIGLTLAAVFPFEFIAKFSGYGASRYYLLLVGIFLVGSLWKRAPVFWKRFLQVALCLLLLGINFKVLANVAGIASGQIRETEKQGSFTLPQQSPQFMLLDCVAARYYFNYRIPQGYIDFACSRPFPFVTPIGGAGVNDIYLIGPGNVDLLKNQGGLDFQPMEKWSPFGISKLAFYKYPWQVFMIPSTACKELKIVKIPEVPEGGNPQ